MKNVAMLTEDVAFALFFRPHPGGFDSSRVSIPGNLPFKAKKMQKCWEGGGWGVCVCVCVGGGGRFGAAGIWN